MHHFGRETSPTLVELIKTSPIWFSLIGSRKRKGKRQKQQRKKSFSTAWLFVFNKFATVTSKSRIICLFQLGVALGFVIPSAIVRNRDTEDTMYMIGDDLFNLFIGVAVLTSILLLAILIGELLLTAIRQEFTLSNLDLWSRAFFFFESRVS